MGNQQEKSSRGQPLGSSQSQTSQTSDQQAFARESRSKLVQSKAKPKELEHKEKILNILEQADNKKNNANTNYTKNTTDKSVPIIQSTIDDNNPIVNDDNADDVNVSSNDEFGFTNEPIPINKTTKPLSSSSATLSTSTIEPATKEARAAEQRIKIKNSKQIGQDRKNRTMDLLFGDALKSGNKDSDDQDSKSNTDDNSVASGTPLKDDKQTKSVATSDVFVASGKAAEAALNRAQTKQSKSSQERKMRTIELLHGDALKDENDVKVAPRDVDPSISDLSPNVSKIQQALLNLQNCNPHDKMPATAKLLRTVVANLVSAETSDEKEKFGKLRLSNNKIKAAFVDMECGLDVLESIGFTKQKLKSKDNVDEEFMVFDFEHKNDEGLWHVIGVIDTYYPDAQ